MPSTKGPPHHSVYLPEYHAAHQTAPGRVVTGTRSTLTVWKSMLRMHAAERAMLQYLKTKVDARGRSHRHSSKTALSYQIFDHDLHGLLHRFH